jgi:hypothetical protein
MMRLRENSSGELVLPAGSHTLTYVVRRPRRERGANRKKTAYSSVQRFDAGRAYEIVLSPDAVSGYTEAAGAPQVQVVQLPAGSAAAPVLVRWVGSQLSAALADPTTGREQALGADYVAAVPGTSRLMLGRVDGAKRDAGAVLLHAGQKVTLSAQEQGGRARALLNIDADAGAAIVTAHKVGAAAPGLVFVHADGQVAHAPGAALTANGGEQTVRAGDRLYIFDASRSMVADNVDRMHAVQAVGAHPDVPGAVVVLLPAMALPAA